MNKKKLEELRDYSKNMMSNSSDPQHTFEHIDRVRENSLKIVKILKVEKKIDINLLQAACLMHDITFSKYSQNIFSFLFEGNLAKRILEENIQKFELSEIERKIIMESIVRHARKAFPFRQLNPDGNLYDKILQDADNLDLFSKERYVSLINSKKLTPGYFLARKMSKYIWRYGRKNMHKYLNFPELSKGWDFGQI